MSTTIRALGRWLGLASIVLAVWAAIMVAMPFVGPTGRDVAVVGDPAAAIRIIRQADGTIIDVRKGAVIARGTHPGFVRALYAAGAPLVIEGRIASGCFPAKAGA